MNRRLNRLNRALGLPASPPPFHLDTDAVCRRVHDALVVQPQERKAYMRHKLKLAAVAAIIVAALCGTALAVASNLDVLHAWFEGDTSSADPMVDREVRSVSDQNYTFTVDSSVSDGENAFLLVRIDALSEAGKAKLNSDDWDGIDLFNIYPLVRDGETGELVHPDSSNCSYGEVREARTETSRSYTVNPSVSSNDGRPAVAVHARLGYMEKGLSIQVPLDPVELATIAIGVTGEGLPSSDAPDGGLVRADSVELSPFTFKLSLTWLDAPPSSSGFPTVPLLFRMKDGTLRGFAQATQEGGQSWHTEHGEDGSHVTLLRRFRAVVDFEQFSGVVLWGKEYPLDGGAPRAVEVDGHLLPFAIPAAPGLSEKNYCSYPVRAFCEGIGATCDWDNAARSATICYQGRTVVLTWGSKTALVDGEAVELRSAPQVFDGKLCIDSFLFKLWDMDGEVLPAENGDGFSGWIIIP